ncbi:MAG: acylphosphatase [Patescibacteria group bacterium]
MNRDAGAKRLEITVRGAVQGVNFRYDTEQEARRLGLTGQVWNNDDGTVGIVAEGPEDKLRELLEWAAAGPDRARVDAHDYRWVAPTGEFKDFAVRR